MSKLVDYIIDDARESTENEEFDTTVGLSEEEILKFINQAQFRLHSKIVAQHPQVFTSTYTFTTVADQEAYSIPSYKAYLKNKVSQVEFSKTNSTNDYYYLRPGYLRERDTGANGDPEKYIRRGGEILMLPTPTGSGGLLRLTYIRKIKKLDKRRGIIKAVTAADSAITNLEITYLNSSSIDAAQLNSNTRFTVVDKYGNIKMENVLLSGITTSASYDATLTVDSSFTYATGESIAVDDYIVSGPYSTTHFELGDEVERYIQLYTEWKILKRDSSIDSQEAIQELAQIEEDIIASYAEISDDILEIPEINEDDWSF
jgi:hypothetical protein